MSEIKYEILEHLGVISISENGWSTELNLVSFNGLDPKYDIRSWSSDKKKMSKGIRLTHEEMDNLVKFYKRSK